MAAKESAKLLSRRSWFTWFRAMFVLKIMGNVAVALFTSLMFVGVMYFKGMNRKVVFLPIKVVTILPEAVIAAAFIFSGRTSAENLNPGLEKLSYFSSIMNCVSSQVQDIHFIPCTFYSNEVNDFKQISKPLAWDSLRSLFGCVKHQICFHIVMFM